MIIESESDIDIDLDNDELIYIQYQEYNKNKLQNAVKPIKMVIDHVCPKYSPACFDIINKYKKSGLEINAMLRRNLPPSKEMNHMIYELDKCFKTLDTLYPKSVGNYIQVYRTMTKEFDPYMTQGYTSTANHITGMSNKYLYKIIIPRDARILVIDISDMVGRKETFEFVLERNVRLSPLGNNDGHTLIVQTPLANKLDF